MGEHDVSESEVNFRMWLKTQRQALALTQADLANQIGYSRDLIYKVEAGRVLPSARFSEKVTSYLGAFTARSPAAGTPLPKSQRSGAELFGSWLARQRQARELTQNGLAALVEYSEDTILALEVGRRRPSRKLAVVLAEKLGVADDDLMDFVRWARGVAGAGPPASVTAREVTGNIPIPDTILIDRVQEVAHVTELLSNPKFRVVTLVGQGGIGKTRLALEVALRTSTDYPDGAWFVDLSRLTEPSQVVTTIAQVLKLGEVSAERLVDTLKASLRKKKLLLVLDNYEHLMGSGPVLSEILAGAPNCKALVTSRAKLNIHRERSFEVPPLALPNLAEFGIPADLEYHAAVQLFITRARDSRGDFMLSAENASSVAAICVQLGGVPFAIELAAARARFLDPKEIYEQLCLRFLAGGKSDQPARLRSMAASIEWSYNLLTREAQSLFRQMAVFLRGFTLDAATAIGAAIGDATTILDLISLIGDNHLVQDTTSYSMPNTHRGKVRFTFPAMIREYALGLLEANGESEAARQAHATYFLALAEQVDPHVERSQLDNWLNSIDDEQDNVRAALGWTLASGATEMAVRMSVSLGAYWWIRGYPSEGRLWIEKAIAASTEEAEDVLAEGLDWVALLARDQGDISQAETYQQTARDLYNRLGNKKGIGRSLIQLGIAARKRGALELALDLLRQGFETAAELDDKDSMARALNTMGTVCMDRGEYDVASDLVEQSLSICNMLDDRMGYARTLNNAGEAARCMGQSERAEELYAEALEEYLQLGNKAGIAMEKLNLGYLTVARGDLSTATQLFTDSLSLSRELANKMEVILGVAGLGIVACARGEFERAATLFGAVEAIDETFEAPIEPSDRLEIDPAIASTRSSLDDATFQAAWTKGRELTLEQAIDAALIEIAKG